jgi:hypothetical protein
MARPPSTTRMSSVRVTTSATITPRRAGPVARRQALASLRTATPAIVMRELPRAALSGSVRAARADAVGAPRRLRELARVGAHTAVRVGAKGALRQPRRHPWPRAPHCAASADKPVRVIR